MYLLCGRGGGGGVLSDTSSLTLVLLGPYINSFRFLTNKINVFLKLVKLFVEVAQLTK